LQSIWGIENLRAVEGVMRNESVKGADASERDVWRKMFWVFALGGSIAMLYYEYLWSRSALRNPATVSFGAWFWTGLTIATPWILCIACLSTLKVAAMKGRVDRDFCLNISVWVEMVMLSAYWMSYRLTSLGALK
jgi:hypothetical protein